MSGVDMIYSVDLFQWLSSSNYNYMYISTQGVLRDDEDLSVLGEEFKQAYKRGQVNLFDDEGWWTYLHTYKHKKTIVPVDFKFQFDYSKNIIKIIHNYVENKVFLWLLCDVQHSVIMADFLMPENKQPIIVIIYSFRIL